MNNLNLCRALCLSSLLLAFGCAKDKNMDDYERDQIQQNLARINAVQATYIGPVRSNFDGGNLGIMSLSFKASTDIQSNSGRTTNGQKVSVSGSLKLQSLTPIEVTFNNGSYDDVNGHFVVSIAIPNENKSIVLDGTITENRWRGTIEVTGQSKFGAYLDLEKNAPPSNTQGLEIGGTRLEEIRNLNYKYVGNYKIDNKILPFILSFTNRNVLPEQELFKLFSGARQVSVKCDLTAFEVKFTNAIIDDTNGTLIANNTADGSNLMCNKFQDGENFGWICDFASLRSIRLTAVK